MTRWILEGEWSGYVSSQRRVVHRTLIRTRKAMEAHAKLRSIRFTDGTRLNLTVRKPLPRERVIVMNGYNHLIQECLMYGVDSVDSLPARAAIAKAEGRGGQP